jgi:Baseplate J-like protein
MASPVQSDLIQVFNDTIVAINPNIDPTIEGSDLYFTSNGLSAVGALIIQDNQKVAKNIFSTSSTGTYLDKHGAADGLLRLGALSAEGYATLQDGTGGDTALANYTILSGVQLNNSINNNIYVVTENVTITMGDSLITIVLPLICTTTGTGTESPSDTILTFATPLTITSEQVITTAIITTMATGSDVESDAQFSLRLYDFEQNPQGGGNAKDYIRWCYLGSSNVTRAEILNTGNVSQGILLPYILVGSNDPNYYVDGSFNNGYTPTPAPINRTASALDILNVSNYIEGVRPITDSPNVVTVGTYELSNIDPIFGNGSYFQLTISLSAGLILTTIITLANNVSLTVNDLILREFRRAILSTPLYGTTISGNQYILVSDIERVIQNGLANTANYQGVYASILVDFQLVYFPQDSDIANPHILVPNLNDGSIFQYNATIDANVLLVVYDIDVTMINIIVES